MLRFVRAGLGADSGSRLVRLARSGAAFLFAILSQNRSGFLKIPFDLLSLFLRILPRVSGLPGAGPVPTRARIRIDARLMA